MEEEDCDINQRYRNPPSIPDMRAAAERRSCILRGDILSAELAFDRPLAMDRNFSESHGGLARLFVRFVSGSVPV